MTEHCRGICVSLTAMSKDSSSATPAKLSSTGRRWTTVTSSHDAIQARGGGRTTVARNAPHAIVTIQDVSGYLVSASMRS
jgi:hypothetical protein